MFWFLRGVIEYLLMNNTILKKIIRIVLTNGWQFTRMVEWSIN